MTAHLNGEDYFLLMAQPPQRVASDQVLKREYLFVVDVSGSMHGFPLDTARDLMQELLARPQAAGNLQHPVLLRAAPGRSRRRRCRPPLKTCSAPSP